LVALSGETLSISGEPLTRFKVSQLGQSTLVVPVKLKKEVVGLLVVVRKAPNPFSPSNKTLLEAVADYASISLVNARLFRALEERARSMQQAAEQAQASDKRKAEEIQNFKKEIQPNLEKTIKEIEDFLVGEEARLNAAQKSAMHKVLDQLKSAFSSVNTLK
jgi:GAF domain-containing protein